MGCSATGEKKKRERDSGGNMNIIFPLIFTFDLNRPNVLIFSRFRLSDSRSHDESSKGYMLPYETSYDRNFVLLFLVNRELTVHI